MAKKSMFDNIENIFDKVVSLGILGFAAIVLLGNLVANSGFTAGTALANLTDNALLNITSGVGSFFSNTPSWFNLLSVVIIIGIIYMIVKRVKSKSGEDIA